MPKALQPISVKEVEQLKTPGLHTVGGVAGLVLQVTHTSRSWLFRYTTFGVRKKIGLGPYPVISLKAARDAAMEIQNKVRLGIDPAQQKRADQVELRKTACPQVREVKLPTFNDCARQYILAHRSSWAHIKHEVNWQSMLDRYADPVIGRLPVNVITVEHMLEVLSPIWNVKTETASRLRGRIELILRYAKALKYRSGENPAAWRDNLEALLPNPKKVAPVKHHEAVDLEAAHAVFQSIRAMDSIGARCLEFTILTACRSGEPRGAVWTEIDLDHGLWTIPARRMKMKRNHRIPLSRAAIDLLRATRKFDNTDLVFSSPQRVHLARPLSDMTLTACHRRLNISATVHGWRSTFKDWAAEKTSYANELSEMALAHSIPSSVESAYRRGDLFERRRAMMDEWAAFLESPR